MNILPIEKFFIQNMICIESTNFPWHEEFAPKWIDDIIARGDEMKRSTNLKSSMTGFDALLEDDLYGPLKEFIFSLARTMPTYNPTRQLTMTDLWGAIYNKGDYADAHEHSPSAYSFVYYLKSSKNSSPLIFPTAGNWSYKPSTSQIIMFPGYLDHLVPESNDDEQRVIIAGNIEMNNPEGIWENDSDSL